MRPLLAWGRDEGLFYLVQPFVEGVLRSLQSAHDHDVLHRDVKPANVIVDDEQPLQRAVLIDYGLALSPGLDPAVGQAPTLVDTGLTSGHLDRLLPASDGSARVPLLRWLVASTESSALVDEVNRPPRVSRIWSRR